MSVSGAGYMKITKSPSGMHLMWESVFRTLNLVFGKLYGKMAMAKLSRRRQHDRKRSWTAMNSSVNWILTFVRSYWEILVCCSIMNIMLFAVHASTVVCRIFHWFPSTDACSLKSVVRPSDLLHLYAQSRRLHSPADSRVNRIPSFSALYLTRLQLSGTNTRFLYVMQTLISSLARTSC